MKRTLPALLVGGFFLASWVTSAFADVVKRTKEIPGRGTVRWAASAVSGTPVVYKLTLGSELLWRHEYPGDKGPSTRSVDRFRHSQLIDVFLAGDDCAFLLSGYEGVHYFCVAKSNGVWEPKKSVTLFGVSASAANPLKSITVPDRNTVETVSVDGATSRYIIRDDGSVTKNGAPYENRPPGSLQIKVEPKSGL